MAAGVLSLSLLFSSTSQSYGFFGVLPVVDWTSIASLVTQVKELATQGQNIKSQADLLRNQSRNWREMGMGQWMNFGSSVVDLGFRADDIFNISSPQIMNTFRSSFPNETKFEGRPYPNADAIALLVNQANSVMKTNEVQGQQILHARNQMRQVLQRASLADTEAKLQGSQLELEAIQVDESQRARQLQMENNKMTAAMAAQMAAEQAAADKARLEARSVHETQRQQKHLLVDQARAENRASVARMRSGQ